MDSNMDANAPDDDGVDFDSLDASQQKELLDNIMQGKPQTPANMNQARNILVNDPDTVAQLCEKLGIDPTQAQDEQNEADDQESEDGQR